MVGQMNAGNIICGHGMAGRASKAEGLARREGGDSWRAMGMGQAEEPGIKGQC